MKYRVIYRVRERVEENKKMELFAALKKLCSVCCKLISCFGFTSADWNFRGKQHYFAKWPVKMRISQSLTA